MSRILLTEQERVLQLDIHHPSTGQLNTGALFSMFEFSWNRHSFTAHSMSPFSKWSLGLDCFKFQAWNCTDFWYSLFVRDH